MSRITVSIWTPLELQISLMLFLLNSQNTKAISLTAVEANADIS
jgi:hypothetical protein